MNDIKETSDDSYCTVCCIQFHNPGEKALHEFSKKHCDNLLKSTKKTSSSIKSPKKLEQKKEENVKAKSTTQSTLSESGTITKYGYFLPDSLEAHKRAQEIRTIQYNYEYDPYLQKLAENPFKEVFSKPVTLQEPIQVGNITSFTRKKKKKRQKTCQLCHVTLNTVPEYEAHMRSPEHGWKLKMSGIGVTAHFVKASSDLHTIDKYEEEASTNEAEAEQQEIDGDKKSVPTSLVSIYCDVCELLLNSEQQFSSHISGSSHQTILKRKMELKAKREKHVEPVSGQLFCYSCQLSLNNLTQYTDHRNGKKHTSKCRQLMKQGITIPPEERNIHLPAMRNPDLPLIYPESYEKYVLQQKRELKEIDEVKDLDQPEADSSETARSLDCDVSFSNQEQSTEQELPSSHSNTTVIDNNKEMSYQRPQIKFHSVSETVGSIQDGSNSDEEKPLDFLCNPCRQILNVTTTVMKDHLQSDDHIIKLKKIFPNYNTEKLNNNNFKPNCRVCSIEFDSLFELASHCQNETHVVNISNLRFDNLTSEMDLLMMQYVYAVEVKPNRFGKFDCVTCNLQLNNSTEYNQHLSSLVHEFADNEEKKKRLVEIREAVKNDENGSYECSLCKLSFSSLLQYNQHLHTLIHKYTKRATNAKKYRQDLRNRKGRMKKYKLGSYQKPLERNPGVRTKVTGVATDLITGEVSSIPNLEPLEPKIDQLKNVNIGATPRKTNQTQGRRQRHHSAMSWRVPDVMNFPNSMYGSHAMTRQPSWSFYNNRLPLDYYQPPTHMMGPVYERQFRSRQEVQHPRYHPYQCYRGSWRC